MAFLVFTKQRRVMGTWSRYGNPTEPRTRTILEEEWAERIEISSLDEFIEREMNYDDSRRN